MRRGLRVGLALLFVMAATACVQTPTVHESSLDNGLKVIVREDHRAPVVVSQLWYKVGGSYEPRGLTGVSHVLEHMMFKGTAAHKAGEFSRIIAANGGRENAFTGRDFTAYYQRLERSRLPISFELEADRMRNLRLDEDEFRKEIQVVMEERRLRTEDQPENLVYERFMATAFTVHPYRNPIIGWMKDLQSIQLSDLQEWYERWYAPGNATLVVVGDVDPEQVFALAQRYFGPHRAPRIEPLTPVVEPKQTATRRVRVQAPAEVPYLLMGFHVPVVARAEARTWEPYALDVLASILGGGNSARLPRELVRGQQIAVNMGVSYDWSARSSTLFMIDGNPSAGYTVAELEAAVLRQIETLKNEPATIEELNRVKAQVVASDIYARDSMFYQAMKIGALETIGLNWRLVDDYVDRIRAVTADQVRQVARKYLVERNMTVAVLDPQPVRSKKRPRPPGGPHADVR